MSVVASVYTHMTLIYHCLSQLLDTHCTYQHTAFYVISHPVQDMLWNLSIKGTLKGHLSNEGTVCSPNHIELCTNLPLN